MITREWLVTNALGGYASGTVAGISTRRFHGVLVAGLPAPIGRQLSFAALWDHVDTGDGYRRPLSGRETFGAECQWPDGLQEFALEDGLPSWRFEWKGIRVDKRLFMPHLRNTTCVTWTLAASDHPVGLVVRPTFAIRGHGERVDAVHGRTVPGDVPPDTFPYDVVREEGGITIRPASDFAPVRVRWSAAHPSFEADQRTVELLHRVERDRGYDFRGPVFSPGLFSVQLTPGESITMLVTTEGLAEPDAANPAEALAAEQRRRQELIAQSVEALRTGVGAELVLAADQFVISPHARTADEFRRQSPEQPPRSVIAGYHWFTDWGRDTMISLEGLTLLTGRGTEAAGILRNFADHVRDGLIPNLFPEGEAEGVYHTADATLWFFHALSRYEHHTGDRLLGRTLRPTLREMIERHVQGTRFGIHVDPEDGLLHQGADGYQLTWMDAKVDGWVVTPRRGKAVEINALFYNALRLMAAWLADDGDAGGARNMTALADHVQTSFNRRFWNAADGCLFDVVDVEGRAGTADDTFRPNQILAVSLPNPVLDPSRWRAVVEAVQRRLVTPFGLRSLAPGSPEYRASYTGDLRARDAAYHQGTVWGWLIGPYLDACRKALPRDESLIHAFLDATKAHLNEAGLGTISEIFDAEPPFAPRGCIAQAWSVAETLRCLAAVEGSH